MRSTRISGLRAPRGRPRPASRLWSMLAGLVLATTGLIPAVTTLAPVAQAAAPAPLGLRVESARAWLPAGLAEHALIPHYQWLITKDDTGDSTRYGANLPFGPGNSYYDCTPQSVPVTTPDAVIHAAGSADPAYPANCQWPSIHAIKGGTTAEVVAQGDETAFNATTAPDLPPGNYMISVTADGFDVPGCTVSATVTCHVDGFKVDGSWFSVAAPASTPPLSPDGVVTVALQPYPLPLATIRARVWNDIQTNGAYDTGEPTLAGFTAKLTDIGGPIQSDWFGNPLCTTYQHDANGVMILDSTTGKPVIQQAGGKCVSDANGDIVIPYMPPQRYSVEVVPPNGQTWYQTTTLEGWHDWDTWAIQGWNGFDPEFIQGGEPFPFAEFGFVQTQACGSPAANPSAGQLTACSGPSDPSVPLTGTTASTGAVKGTVLDTTAVSPAVGGVPIGGAQGNIVLGPMNSPLVSLIDTNRDDTTVWVGRGAADGTFQINHVPDGDYVMTYWDEDQSYLLTEVNVSVQNGQVVDLGNLDAAAWWGEIHGRVCFDTNRNGKCESGEPGLPNLVLNLLGRDNSLQPSGDNAATTGSDGSYEFPRAYPLGQFVVLQGYWEQFYTVGVTYQSINQPTETTQMANGGFVDLSTLNQIGMETRVDWAVHTYETNPALGPTNGGIVGEMYYNNVQIEEDGRFQTIQPSEPGIPNFTVHLYDPVKCDPAVAAPAGDACTAETTAFGTSYYLTSLADGTLVHATGFPVPCDPADSSTVPSGDSCVANAAGDSFLQDATNAWVTGEDAFTPYTSETWQRPVDCVARDASGNQVVEQVLPPSTGGHDCLEAPLMNSQVSNNADTGVGMTVNGNYGFTTVATFDATGAPQVTPIGPGDYVVFSDSPKDINGNPIWRPSLEEDVNGYTGDEMVAPGETPVNPPTPVQPAVTPVTPAIPPFPCVGPLHTVHVVADRSQALFNLADPTHTSGIYNPGYLDAGGGNPYEGTQKPLCNAQLVTVRNGRSATPNFSWIDQSWVPLPSRIFGLVVDDLNLSTNPKELFFGEKYGIPNLPVGIYDFSNRLIKTVNTDPNGMFEVELPSTTISDCPSPASVCPGMYRYLANDPGQPDHPNANYNAAYRTIGAFFESWPGISGPADLAPTPSAVTIELPGTATKAPAACLVNDPAQPTAPLTPELFSIDRPFLVSTSTARTFTLKGVSFGATQGSVTLDGTPMTIGSWTDRQISFTVPAGFATGPHQLTITGSDGRASVNGLTFHVLGTGYNPTLFQVGPGLTGTRTFDPNAASHNTGGYEHAIQDALNAAASSSQALVVVYPGPTGPFNPLGGYFENVIMHSPVKLQGVGPGGVYPDNTHVPGTVLDGLGFGTDGARDTGWAAVIAGLPTIQAPPTAAVPEGEVILAVATSANQFGSAYKAAIDGMTVQNGDVMDFNANFNNVGNGPTAFNEGGQTPNNPSQGGGIVAFDATRFLQITNNIIRSNTGAYGGAIRLGTPTVGDNRLDGTRIANNRILNNGGSNLAGAVGIFTGTYGYEVSGNDLCGNFSAEYGGGISHFGLTGNLLANGNRAPNSTTGTPSSIHDNRIYFNGSYDEGGGVLIAGEPPLTPTTFGAGAGPVNVYNNLVEANLANDDGGGLRFLTAGNFPYNVYNNIIVNNISTHEGGGVAIDNAPNLRFFNNTVMKNQTTATAATSNGQPAPAGLSTGLNNDFLQATLPVGSPLYSNPLLFNNVFWDNRAGTWDAAAGMIRGVGSTDLLGQPDPTPINHWDMGVPGTAFQLSPTNSILQTETPPDHNDVVSSPTNKPDQDPLVTSTYDASILALPWRGNPNFIANVIVAQDVPVTIMGDYHISGTGSPAFNMGAASKSGVSAPTFDIDRQARPALGGFDSGADEFPGAQANLSITKTDGVTSVTPGGAVSYTITVANAGPAGVALAPVTDTVPASLTGATWTCTAPGGSTCGAASGSGSITTTVTLPAGGSATFTLNGTVATSANGTLANTASVAAPAGTTDPTPGNNSATDSDLVTVPLPALGLLDNFNRANANTLGANWSQVTLLGLAAIRLNANQAQDVLLAGQATWNGATGGGPAYGARQGAAFTFSASAGAPTAPVNGSALILKASGGSATVPANFIRVRYTGSAVEVATTTNAGLTTTSRGTFPVTLATGDTLSAVAYADGTVNVYRTSGATTTEIGSVTIPTAGAGAWTQGTGGGRIGIQLPATGRVDNFSGGTVP